MLSFHRSNDFEHVEQEVRQTRASVGVSDISNFAKYEVYGSGAEAFLSRFMTNSLPPIGYMVLTPMLNQNGKLVLADDPQCDGE